MLLPEHQRRLSERTIELLDFYRDSSPSAVTHASLSRGDDLRCR